MKRNELLDHYYLDARARLIDIAAFLDRLDRADGDADFRHSEFRKAIRILGEDEPDRARRVLEALSDTTTDPIDKAPGKGAVGAYNPAP